MCVKVANDELGSMKALMSMSLNAIILDVFDLDRIKMQSNLMVDLNMDESQELQLKLSIAEYFDGCHIRITDNHTVQSIHDEVVSSQFNNIDIAA